MWVGGRCVGGGGAVRLESSSVEHPAQAMREVVTAATLAFDGGSAADRAAACKSWKEMALDFWRNAGEGGATAPTLYRTKAFQWLVATGFQLMTATGRGWSSFLLAPEIERPPPECWNSITVSIDQGSDGWSACQYLTHASAVIITLFDTSHRLWNDCQAALRSSGLWHYCLLMVICLNLDNGPWDGAKWWEELKQGASEYSAVSTASCPVFQKFLPAISEEMGLDEHDLLDPNRVAEVHAEIGSVFARKVAKVGMSRWFQFTDSAREFTKLWSRRLVITVFMVMMLGSTTKDALSKVMNVKIPIRSEADDVEKSTTKDDREEIRRARLACKNTMEFTLAMLSKRELYRVMVIIARSCQAVREQHSSQCVSNRSPEESFAWWTFCAKTKGLVHINDILSMLSGGAEVLKELGCHTVGCHSTYEEMDPEHPIVLGEDDLAARLGDLTLALATSRLRTAVVAAGYPYKFVLLADPEVGDAVAAEVIQDFEDWQSLQLEGDRFWRKVAARHPLRTAHSLQLWSLLRAAGGVRSETLVRLVRGQFSGVTATKIVEDAVREERVEEGRVVNKKMSGQRAWNTLVTARLEETKYRFRAVPWSAQEITRGAKDRSTAGLFSPNAKSTPASFRDIVSAKSSPPYTSLSPSMSIAPSEDRALHKHLKQTDAMHAGKNSWLSVLGRGKRQLLSHPTMFDGRWFISCGTAGGSCCLGVPVEEVLGSDKAFLRVAQVDAIYFLPIYNLYTWKSMMFTWRSPLGARVRCGSWLATGLVLHPLAAPAPLVEMAAREAFFDIPKSGLLRIGAFLEADLDSKGTLATILVGLCVFVLGALTEQEKLVILRKRLTRNDDMTAFLQSEEAKDLLEKSDVHKLEKEAAEEAAEEDPMASGGSIKHAIKALAAEMRLAPGGRGKGGPRARGRGRDSGARGSADGAKKPRKYPPSLKLDDDFDIKDIEELLPAGARIAADRLDQSWRLSAYGTRTTRSWGLYGQREAALLLVKIAWDLALETGHEVDCPWPL